MGPLRVVDLGRGVPYAEGMAKMREAMARVDDDGPVLLLLEHAPVITTTRQGGTAFVHTPVEVLRAEGIDVEETDRGGDVTFHGPGQLVGYPIVRLCPPGDVGDLLGFLRALESSLVRTCQRLGVKDAHRVEGATGVWCDVGGVESKLVAIGIGLSRGVTRHGFALNVTTDLERYTRHITPCGLVGRSVTSLERVLPAVPGDDVIRAVLVEELRL